jgi:hypothetical protein
VEGRHTYVSDRYAEFFGYYSFLKNQPVWRIKTALLRFDCGCSTIAHTAIQHGK